MAKKHEYEINGVILEINMNDADFTERYASSFEEMQEYAKTLPTVGKQADIIRAYCSAFYKLFDGIFGYGTGEKLFNGKYDSEICEETYEKFLTICREQVETSKKRKARIIGGNSFRPPVQ